jgi:putative DNA primase/helicase
MAQELGMTSSEYRGAVRSRLEKVPHELRELHQWVAWKWEKRADTVTKVPVDPKTGRWASTTDENTWNTFEYAVKCAEQRQLAGIGFVFTVSDRYAGIDLDSCRDAEAGVIESWAADLIDEFDTYTEVSPSGKGVKMFVRGEVPGEQNRQGNIEMYSQERFFTVTGQHLPHTPVVIKARGRVLTSLYRELFAESSMGNGSEGAASKPISPPLDDEEVLNKLRSESTLFEAYLN